MLLQFKRAKQNRREKKKNISHFAGIVAWLYALHSATKVKPCYQSERVLVF